MIASMTSYLPPKGALVRRASHAALALATLALSLSSAHPVAAEVGLGGRDLSPPWMVQTDASMGLPAISLGEGD